MPNTKVIIVGCGITGPVLATFLKLKGYEPIIYERVQENTESGVGLMLQPNGLRVLSLIPGFDIESIPGQYLDRSVFHSWMPEEQATLAESDTPTKWKETFGFQMKGVERTGLQRLLVKTAQNLGVEIKWNHSLLSLEQGSDEVRVVFENGHTDTASFVVGCDGLHSSTRASLFGREKADFTGLTQTGGLTLTGDKTPRPFRMVNIFGNNKHLIAYPISSTEISWAVTLREGEARETWREMDAEKQEEFKNGPHSNWGFECDGLVKASTKIVKYGLYDRPELKSWHQERVALLGDAAHPTSPHLGQGANQGFEDIYHLVRLLVKHNPEAMHLSTEKLSAIFAEYEGVRIPRTSALVKGARQAGEGRVVEGVEACLARNDTVRKMWEDEDRILEASQHLYNQPFQGQSEI